MPPTQLTRQEFKIDRRGLGLFFRGRKHKARFDAQISSRVCGNDTFDASDSISGFDPWDANPQGRLVIDARRQLVRVFRMEFPGEIGFRSALLGTHRVAEYTFEASEIAKVAVEAKSKGMEGFWRPAPSLELAGAMVGGVPGVLTAAIVRDLLSLREKRVDLSLRVRFHLVSGEEVWFEFLKPTGYLLQAREEAGRHFEQFVHRVAEAAERCAGFLNHHFAAKLANDIPVARLDEVSDSTFDSEVLDSGIPVLVAYWDDNHDLGPMVAPTLSAIAADWAGKVKVVHSRAWTQHNVRVFPSLQLFRDGRMAAQHLGWCGKSDVQRILQEHVGSSPYGAGAPRRRSRVKYEKIGYWAGGLVGLAVICASGYLPLPDTASTVGILLGGACPGIGFLVGRRIQRSRDGMNRI